MRTTIKTILCATALFLMTGCGEPEVKTIHNTLRAPAYPLITIDPYTSAWSMTDNLYDGPVRHWSNTELPMMGALRVDGTVYRFMGMEAIPYTVVAGMSTDTPWRGRYTHSKPAAGWEKPGFDDSKWTEGAAAFGTENEMSVGTVWTSRDVWVRRTVELSPQQMAAPLYLRLLHDDNVELYINGEQVVRERYLNRKEVVVTVTDEMKSKASNGCLVIAAWCENTAGDAYLDFGIYTDPSVNEYLGNAAVQKSVDVQPTRTDYMFACGPVELQLSFLAPLLMHDLDLMSRPVNYISYDVRSTDGAAHDVQIYFETAPAWALNFHSQPNISEGFEKDGMTYLKTGGTEQKILGRAGDNVRIDWGWFYLAAENGGTTAAVGDFASLRSSFASQGVLNGDVAPKGKSNMGLARALGMSKKASGKVMVGYDDICSIQYFGENLRPYWNRLGNLSIEEAFGQALYEYEHLKAECAQFDYDLMRRAVDVAGQEYAELCALAYRQSVAAHKLVEAPNGDLLWLSKENFSNGSIGTVDITYPSAPLYLLYNTDLAKGLMNHIFYYSESGRWTKPFPSHDVGTYPLANGQTYGGDMPVEEAGNMLVLTAAIAAMEGNAEYAEKHWDMLTVWVDYLMEKGLDPENQLCTDDFAGHFAHNANLSIKAVMGIASYGYCAGLLGKTDAAEKYTVAAKNMAQKWMQMADDGDHYRLTFDRPGTWSQKYNLVWDKLLGLGIFPAEVAQKEIAYYLTKQNKYGLPLDSRRNYTKSDWIMWTATLAGDIHDFGQFITPVWRFYNETTDRVPMSDWYNTDSPTHVGFRARSVVGGFYIKLLEDKMQN